MLEALRPRHVLARRSRDDDDELIGNKLFRATWRDLP